MSPATALQEEYGIALPQYGANAQWTSTDEANSTPVIGEILAVNQGDKPVDFKTLVSSAKEFNGSGIFRIQESIASPVLEAKNGDLVLFRLTETDATRVPNNIDEVAEQISYDLGRIARWETLQAESDLIEQNARADGMLAASLKYNAEVSSPITVSMIETGVPSILDAETARPLMAQSVAQRIANGNNISDMATDIPALGQNDRELIQEIVNRTHEYPLDVPITKLPIDQQVFIVQSPENMALVLVRISELTPASVELANAFTSGNTAILQTILSFDELGGITSIGDTFSFDTLASRHNFERGPKNVSTEDEEVETEVN